MTKKVKKLMLEKQIPSHLRDRIPIICDDNGIVAIPSVAIRDGSIGTKNDIILRIYK
ncbi:MAG: tRNA lysidine(34) synthetase TilS [Clostridia bacterium]|nr:tRNA lysidine(34) synthetase TilS [Clostridia bacterium]